MLKELEQKQKELLWQNIALINEQIKERKIIQEKDIVLFNRCFQKELSCQMSK